jgi:hypothetical protein
VARRRPTHDDVFLGSCRNLVALFDVLMFDVLMKVHHRRGQDNEEGDHVR